VKVCKETGKKPFEVAKRVSQRKGEGIGLTMIIKRNIES
jgi:hypothetical protein